MPRTLTPEQMRLSYEMKEAWDDAVKRGDRPALQALQQRIRAEFPWSSRADTDLDRVLDRRNH